MTEFVRLRPASAFVRGFLAVRGPLWSAIRLRTRTAALVLRCLFTIIHSDKFIRADQMTWKHRYYFGIMNINLETC